ncbi:hypothetical protein [Hymenobacter elongatus]|uniref:Uncharacterized protein n=1 Tax=Hymenobacter elongatus TaxID=877208 RepID=A0A4Z0PKL3_9BACT|nr:hypothetical protein [Hymenobacter elongatus]TGE16295.1 hypothetical protein E5J99_10480 [Hymenobacter elongatus]
MNQRRSSLLPTSIALLGKVMNVALLLVCSGATIWAIRLFVVRWKLPYTAAGTYYNPRTGVTYDEHIVAVALGLLLLFGLLTLLLLASAYRLYVAAPSRKVR